MEDIEGPFDHFWGPLNDNDFDSKPLFESQLMDNDAITRGVDCSYIEGGPNVKCCSSQVEYKGSIADRRAAKFGFNASRINEEHVKISSPPSSSCGPSPARSPYLTIPPGISPAALLESPVMLPNSQPSPTTGTFPLAPFDHDNSSMNSFSPGTDRESDIGISSFGLFRSQGDFAQIPCTSNAGDQISTSSKAPSESIKRASVNCLNMETYTKNDIAINMTSTSNHVDMQSSTVDIMNHQEPLLRECIKVESGINHSLEVEQKGVSASTKTSNAGDGYCWRKYGQKHVKGSEYPRSYYKCNNANCLVKKKVERSHDGEITEIIYKGAHNHPKPNPRLSLGNQATSGEMLDSFEVVGSPNLEGETGWRFNQMKSQSGSSDGKADGPERTSSGPVLNEICDPSSTNQGKSMILFGSGQSADNASTIGSQNGDDQDGFLYGSTSPSEDADGDESEPKRRKKEAFSSEAYLPSRSTREPRIILQIESEIDVLDDGYRWRKYGQKVVKGNPNPRSYYKCTSAGCPVRKHVERASEDIKSVVTTYEGKHNHEVPTTKTMGAAASGVGPSPTNVTDPNPVLTLPRNPNAPNEAVKLQDFPMHYPMKPALGNEFVPSTLLGDFVHDMKLGVPSIYQMKFPPLQSPLPYAPFMMNSNGNDFHTPAIVAPLMHDLPMISASSRTNYMAVGGFHPNHHTRPGGPLQSSIGIQQMKQNDFRFFKPKEEQKDEHSFDTCLTPPDNRKPSSAVFYRADTNFPS